MRKGAKIHLVDPMVEINTTPLIDVLMVLLVMLIITVPPQSHAVKLDLPGPPPNDFSRPNPFVNNLEITRAGATLRNGMPVSDAAL